MRNILLLGAALLAAAPTLAQANDGLEPMSARRLYLLCHMESPLCRIGLDTAYQAFLANPWVTMSGTTYNCRGALRQQLKPVEVYARFFQLMESNNTYLWDGWSAQAAMYQTLNLSGVCEG